MPGRIYVYPWRALGAVHEKAWEGVDVESTVAEVVTADRNIQEICAGPPTTGRVRDYDYINPGVFRAHFFPDLIQNLITAPDSL